MRNGLPSAKEEPWLPPPTEPRRHWLCSCKLSFYTTLCAYIAPTTSRFLSPDPPLMEHKPLVNPLLWPEWNQSVTIFIHPCAVSRNLSTNQNGLKQIRNVFSDENAHLPSSWQSPVNWSYSKNFETTEENTCAMPTKVMQTSILGPRCLICFKCVLRL